MAARTTNGGDTVAPRIRAFLREFASHARRTAIAPDKELAIHLDLLVSQLRAVSAIRAVAGRAPTSTSAEDITGIGGER